MIDKTELLVFDSDIFVSIFDVYLFEIFHISNSMDSHCFKVGKVVLI